MTDTDTEIPDLPGILTDPDTSPGIGSTLSFDADAPVLDQVEEAAARFARIWLYAMIPLLTDLVVRQSFGRDALLAALVASIGTAWREFSDRTEAPARLMSLVSKRRPYTSAGSRGFGEIGAPGSKLGRAWAAKNITRFTLANGVKINAHRQAGPILVAFLDECIARGYKIRQKDTGSWNHRWINRLGKPLVGRLSNHSWGTAVDVNWSTNPQAKKLRTDMPQWMIALGEGKYRLVWGGRFTLTDSMHWEWGGTPAEAVALRKTLGV
jgi:hypothetical protein